MLFLLNLPVKALTFPFLESGSFLCVEVLYIFFLISLLEAHSAQYIMHTSVVNVLLYVQCYQSREVLPSKSQPM